MRKATLLAVVILILSLTPAIWIGASSAMTDPAAPPDVKQMDRLIHQLGSDDFEEREAASKELSSLGRLALKAIRQSAKSEIPEVRRRLEILLEEIDGDAIALREFGVTMEVDTDRPDEPVIYAGLNCSPVPDRIVAHLGRIDSLLKVELFGEAITDAGVMHLRGLKHLRELSLAHSAVTDDGLASLTELYELEHLNLSGTKITGAGLKHLQGLNRLCILYLDRTAVNDDGLAELEGVPGLLVLRLAGTKITDAGLKHLRGMKDLRLLDVSHTAVTDAGLASLAELHELRRLDAIATKVTAKGMADLAQSLPKLENP
jgi:hypothetical protein